MTRRRRIERIRPRPRMAVDAVPRRRLPWPPAWLILLAAAIHADKPLELGLAIGDRISP